MGNILKYQNPSSPLLNTSYKKYEGEDLSDIETFNKNWLKYRDSQLAKQGWLDESIKNKLTWLQRNFGTSDKTVGNLVREQLFSNLDNTRELSFSDAVKDSQGRYLLTESMYSDFPGERELYEVEIGPPKPVDDWKLDYAFNGSVKGTHYPDFNTIIYGDKYQHTPIKIHERDHAMFGQYGNDNIGLKIVENIFKQEFLDNVSDKWGYYDDPDEIRARLMEMRFNNKLDPTHKYTLEEIENMRNDPNFKDDHIFNRYTNKYIEYLLNTVAQNITDPNRIDYRDPVTIAKKGSKIHIKKKNRGKFTDYCGGKVTQECIARGKKSKDPKIRKRATFAANARKWKHENGGILKYQNPFSPLLIPVGSMYGGELEPAVIKPEPIKAELNTYYPIVSKDYPWTGHSELILHHAGPQKSSVIVSKGGHNPDYNLVTNNCSDATRCAVEQIYGEKINPFLFTTPGDVRDFLLKKGIDRVKTKKGVQTQYFEIPFATAMDLRNQEIDRQIEEYKYKASKYKEKEMREYPKWNPTAFDESTQRAIDEYNSRKYIFQPFVE